ncbi:hypothetical protein NC653_021769 [Populus alba x Populus x berolinensis]|uniref:Uncharacterized protein n=1 Tax=Populus alba x Populus x berolinensis TaxID=444605 RepID=A0AAD6QE70_9ROSI|nr:hypothetical protein NC653_021769 [Populus alba x Populus x berolinensis]
MSLTFSSTFSSGGKPYKDDGSRRKNSRKHGSKMVFNSIVSMSEEPLSKSDTSKIRRTQAVTNSSTVSLMMRHCYFLSLSFLFF